MRTIDGDDLYKRTAEWEEQAQAEVLKNKGCRTVEEWDEYRKWLIILNERSSFKYDVADAPTIEAELKHGRWVHKYGDGHTETAITGGECSICGFVNTATNYCPNCGTKMDEVEE